MAPMSPRTPSILTALLVATIAVSGPAVAPVDAVSLEAEDGPGDVADDGASQPNVVVDRRGNAVAMPVGHPPQGKVAGRGGAAERILGGCVVIL